MTYKIYASSEEDFRELDILVKSLPKQLQSLIINVEKGIGCVVNFTCKYAESGKWESLAVLPNSLTEITIGPEGLIIWVGDYWFQYPKLENRLRIIPPSY